MAAETDDYISILKSVRDTIPIIVICYNNAPYVKNTIEQLVRINDSLEDSIIVMDNCSSDEKTISYLRNLVRVKVIWNKTNAGPWINKSINKHIYDNLPNKFILTDPDLQFNPNLPRNFIDQLLEISNTYKVYGVGFALDITYFPTMFQGIYNHGLNIFQWEYNFWSKPLPHDKYELYDADIDTTFHLINKHSLNSRMIRVGGNFVAKHLPWYVENPILTMQQQHMYYRNSKFSCIANLFRQHIKDSAISVVSKNQCEMLVHTNIDNNASFWLNEYSNWKPEKFVILDKYLSDDKSYLDIGSWIGTTCIYAALKARYVVAVEGDPQAIKSLHANVKLNVRNIDIEESAIYCENNTEITFGPTKFLPNACWNDGTSQIKSSVTRVNDIVVPTINLASLIDKYHLHDLSLIKVDIGGGEEYILDDLLTYQHDFAVPIYISFYYAWWQNKDINRFKLLTKTQRQQIMTEPFCAILFT